MDTKPASVRSAHVLAEARAKIQVGTHHVRDEDMGQEMCSPRHGHKTGLFFGALPLIIFLILWFATVHLRDTFPQASSM